MKKEMADEDACIENGHAFCKSFYNMVNKVKKFFTNYEKKSLKNENKKK